MNGKFQDHLTACLYSAVFLIAQHARVVWIYRRGKYCHTTMRLPDYVKSCYTQWANPVRIFNLIIIFNLSNCYISYKCSKCVSIGINYLKEQNFVRIYKKFATKKCIDLTNTTFLSKNQIFKKLLFIRFVIKMYISGKQKFDYDRF